MLCGVEERRREMIACHEPVGRIFDVVEIEAMSPEESRNFFARAFESVQMTVEPRAMDVLVQYSTGFPKIMHLLGDAAYWIDSDGRVDHDDSLRAVVAAAEEVGRKYVDQQIYAALRSEDYRSILFKSVQLNPLELRFHKNQVAASLTEGEKRKLNNFLQRMKRLKAIRSGDVKGEYVFTQRMVQIYLWLKSLDTSGGGE